MKAAYGQEEMPENPIISNYLRTGYWNGKEPAYPRCPVCWEECETIYKDKHGEILGCENCVRSVDAWEAMEDGADLW